MQNKIALSQREEWERLKREEESRLAAERKSIEDEKEKQRRIEEEKERKRKEEELRLADENERENKRLDLMHTLNDMDAKGELNPKAIFEAIINGALPHVEFIG